MADYRRQFEKTARKEGEDPSIFAITLETLAVKVLGTWAMRHDSVSYMIDLLPAMTVLGSVSPETPIRDIVDRCQVWESHTDTEARRFSTPGPERALPIYTVDESGRGTDDQMVVAVTFPPAASEPLETLLRRLLPTPVKPTLPPKPVPTELERMLQRLLLEVQTPNPTPPAKSGITGLETLWQGLLPRIPAPAP